MDSGNSHLWTYSGSINSILERYQMNKKFMSLVVLLATAILSGYALLTFLKKAGIEDIFEFDLGEDIDEDFEEA